MRLAVAVIGLALAGWEPFRAPHPEVERGNRAYAEQRWDDAIAAYERARGDGAAGPTVDFDVGTALLRKAEAMAAGPERAAIEDRALAALTRAAAASDRGLRARAHYNRGNALLGRDRVDDAIAAYKDALRADRDFEDARLNLEQALKRRAKTPPSSPGRGGQGGQGRGNGGPRDRGDQPGAQGQPDARGRQDQPGQQQPGPQGQQGSAGPGQASPSPGDPDDGQGNTSPDTPAQPPGGNQPGTPRGQRPTPRSPSSPAERKLDDLERSSRDLRREQIRRRAQESYRPPNGPDW